jgi:hypothetical protein
MKLRLLTVLAVLTGVFASSASAAPAPKPLEAWAKIRSVWTAQAHARNQTIFCNTKRALSQQSRGYNYDLDCALVVKDQDDLRSLVTGTFSLPVSGNCKYSVMLTYWDRPRAPAVGTALIVCKAGWLSRVPQLVG